MTNERRSVVRQFRIMSKKPGDRNWVYRRFPGSQVTGDQPLAWQHLQRARDQTPAWEFEMAEREIITITRVGNWVMQ
jgi:hypothetical protein